MKAFFYGRAGKVSPAEAVTPTSHQKKRPPSRGTKENVDPNPGTPGDGVFHRTPSAAGRLPLAPASRSPLPPRPPPNNHDTPLKKKKLCLDNQSDNRAAGALSMDSGVQVIVRMRPLNEMEEGDQIVQKISSNSVSILDNIFTFDSVADARSTQEEIFQLVGVPLVENCLAGFNSSIFAYGQTGSGKTYTMWGPANGSLEDVSISVECGLTPRVFERLFNRIHEEEEKHSDKQLTFQCHCSFLEIYNEQIMDLLDPSRKNLQIREDVRTGIYVDCLSEEYVCSVKDVNQLLMKGLENRRTGATSINAESSRSHCVFTCIIESRSKSIADGLNSLRISRINLVDLAGSERQKLTGAAGDRLKEAGNINRSLSQLGNLINILAEVSQSGKQRHIPYRDSKLTFLLQESLGGNAKLAMICAVSPSQSCKNETFSTLRFAKRAKAIKNKAVVNEIMQDDVKVLREQIRQLKDELLRMKSGMAVEGQGSYSTGWSVRRSLNLLKMSLGRPATLPVIDDDGDEEMEIDDDIGGSCMQSCLPSEEIMRDEQTSTVENVDPLKPFLANKSVDSSQEGKMPDHTKLSCGNDQIPEAVISMENCTMKSNASVCAVLSPTYDGCIRDGIRDTSQEKAATLPECNSTEFKVVEGDLTACVSLHTDEHMPVEPVQDLCHNVSSVSSHDVASNLCIVPCDAPLQSSLKVDHSAIQCLQPSPSMSQLQNNPLKNLKPCFEDEKQCSSQNKSNKRKSSISSAEHLAASLHQGIKIIDSHLQKSRARCSSFRFSCRPVDLKPLLPIAKIDIGTQTMSSTLDLHEDSPPFVCSYCKNGTLFLDSNHQIDHKDLQLVPADGSQSADASKIQVSKAVEKVLAGAIRREMALEDHCAKQNAEIAQLKSLIQQYKHERECNTVIEQIREDKISRLESLMDGILPTDEFMSEEYTSLLNEYKILKEKYDNHPEVLRTNVALRRVQEELEKYTNFFDLGEREILIEELQDLKSHLQYYIDNSPMPPRRRTSLLKLTYPSQPTPVPLVEIPESTKECAHNNFEEERQHWIETESKWISLSEELREELEASRSIAERLRMELDAEKRCSEEMKEALQTAMKGHAHILDQYADLQEKHFILLARNQQIRDGIEDIKQAAAKAGVKGAESKFINSLAAQVSALKAEREKERRYWKDENKGLQTQLRDTAEALQAAGELLLRLKEAEEAAAIAQKRTITAEKKAEEAYQEIENLRTKHEKEMARKKQCHSEFQLTEGDQVPRYDDVHVVKYDDDISFPEEKWREEFGSSDHDNAFSDGAEQSSWFSGYDQCNI